MGRWSGNLLSFPYEHVTLATKDVDPALWEVAWRTCQAVPAVTWGSWSRTMLNIAHMGDRARIVEAMMGHLAQDNLIASANMMPGNDSKSGHPGGIPGYDDAVSVAATPVSRKGPMVYAVLLGLKSVGLCGRTAAAIEPEADRHRSPTPTR